MINHVFYGLTVRSLISTDLSQKLLQSILTSHKENSSYNYMHAPIQEVRSKINFSTKNKLTGKPLSIIEEVEKYKK